jgi:hypothetical protein
MRRAAPVKSFLPLPARVGKGAKRAHADELLCDLTGGAAVRGLMQGGVERQTTWSRGVDKTLVLREQFKHLRPVVALGGVGEGITDSKCLRA